LHSASTRSACAPGGGFLNLDLDLDDPFTASAYDLSSSYAAGLQRVLWWKQLQFLQRTGTASGSGIG